MKIFLARFAIKSRVVRYMKKNQMVMKRIASIILIVLAAVLFTSCRSLTYRAHRLEHKALRTNDEVEKRRYLAAADWYRTVDSVNKVADYFKNDTLYLPVLYSLSYTEKNNYDTLLLKSIDYLHVFETPIKPYHRNYAFDLRYGWSSEFRGLFIYHSLDGRMIAYKH